MTIEELAQLGLDVLFAQQAYFKQRTPENLKAAKVEEAKLSRACRAILDPTKLSEPERKAQASLFHDALKPMARKQVRSLALG